MIPKTLHTEWIELLADEFEKPYFSEIIRHYTLAKAHSVIFPPSDKTFHALNLTPPSRVREIERVKCLITEGKYTLCCFGWRIVLIISLKNSFCKLISRKSYCMQGLWDRYMPLAWRSFMGFAAASGQKARHCEKTLRAGFATIVDPNATPVMAESADYREI